MLARRGGGRSPDALSGFLSSRAPHFGREKWAQCAAAASRLTAAAPFQLIWCPLPRARHLPRSLCSQQRGRNVGLIGFVICFSNLFAISAVLWTLWVLRGVSGGARRFLPHRSSETYEDERLRSPSTREQEMHTLVKTSERRSRPFMPPDSVLHISRRCFSPLDISI